MNNNYKGLYHNQRIEQRYYEGGAHFKYSELYYLLESLQKSQFKKEKENNHPTASTKIKNNNTIYSRNLLSLLKSNTQKYYNINPPKKKEFNRSIIISDSFAQKNKSSLNIHPRTNSEESKPRQEDLFLFNHPLSINYIDKAINKILIKPSTYVGYNPLYLANANGNKAIYNNGDLNQKSRNNVESNNVNFYKKIPNQSRQILKKENQLGSLSYLKNINSSLGNLHEKSGLTSIENLTHSFIKRKNYDDMKRKVFTSSANNVIGNYHSISPINPRMNNNSFFNRKITGLPIESYKSRNRINKLYKANKEDLHTIIQEEQKQNKYTSLCKRNIEVKKHNNMTINTLYRPKLDNNNNKMPYFASGFGLELLHLKTMHFSHNHNYKTHNKYTKMSLLEQNSDYSLFNKKNINVNDNNNTSYIIPEKKREIHQQSLHNIKEQTLNNIFQSKLFCAPIAKNSHTHNNKIGNKKTIFCNDYTDNNCSKLKMFAYNEYLIYK